VARGNTKKRCYESAAQGGKGGGLGGGGEGAGIEIQNNGRSEAGGKERKKLHETFFTRESGGIELRRRTKIAALREQNQV